MLPEVAKQLRHQFTRNSPHEGLGHRRYHPAMHRLVHFRQRRQKSSAGAPRSNKAEIRSFWGQPSHVTAYERKLLPRTRLEIYDTPKGKRLVLSFEGKQRLISKGAASAIPLGLRNILADL